ncbi:MAG: hypothetical protein B6I31_02965 [Desulfobacteraceae bacterium 4572_19]|nr:MAG: hypothetical protein B6I31_02965 [Desulfobacteraceae bacterium 4572_19]
MNDTTTTAKPSILIVDDIPENLFVLNKLLKKLDVNVVQASSGNEALAATLDHDFCMILLDVQMPEMNGYEVADILKSDESTASIPIIFVTAIDRDDAKEIKGYHEGAVDFLFKPLNEFILRSKVKVFLELYKIRSGLEDIVNERTKKLREEVAKHKSTSDNLAKAKSYLDGVLNSISSVIVGLDSEGKITEMNAAAQKISGVSAEDATGKKIKKIFPFYNEFLDEVKELIGEGTSVNELPNNKPDDTPDKTGKIETTSDEQPVKIPDNKQDKKSLKEHKGFIEFGEFVEKSKVTVHVNDEFHINNFAFYPLKVDDVQGAVLKVDNVTEKAKTDEMMIQTEKMLTMGGLAAGMAHEINNPLAGILQNVQVMRNRMQVGLAKNQEVAEEIGVSMEAIQEYMEKRGLYRMIKAVLEAGKRGAKVVENMLSFSRKSESKGTKLDIKDLIESSLGLAENDYGLKKTFNFKQIEIQREYQEDIPKVYCERSKIQQVLLNLFKNSAHAMNEEGADKPPKIIIRIKAKGDNAQIEIEDNGCGMTEDVQKKALEPFFTTKAVGIGTGLGLSVSNFIITENYKGSIRIISSPGKGANFIIQLPFDNAQQTTNSPVK